MHLVVVYADSCDCRPGQPMVDGTLPLYYDRETQAIGVFEQLREQARSGVGPVYYAVHVRGRHVLQVNEEGQP